MPDVRAWRAPAARRFVIILAAVSEPVVDRAALDFLVDRTLVQLAAGAQVGPTALRLLVRQFAATARDELRDALEPALGRAVDSSSAALDDAESLLLLVEALGIADDEALDLAVVERAAQLRRRWPSRGVVADAMRAVEACVAAAASVSRTRDLVDAVDELERLLGLVYEPGSSLPHLIGGPADPPGDLHDHAATAGALLTTHAATGQLPYAMLAEEVMQTARRTHGRPARHHSDLSREEPAGSFLAECDAAVVLCRLAAVRSDPEYQLAVTAGAPDDYAAWAVELLARWATTYQARGTEAAAYGLAVHEWLQRCAPSRSV